MKGKSRLGFLYRTGVCAAMMLLCFAGAGTAAQAQTYLTINGDPLVISSDEYGTMGVQRWQDGTLVRQYYSTYAKASALFLNGADVNSRWGNGTSSFQLFTGNGEGTDDRYVPVSNTQVDPWTIRTIFDAGTSGVRITQTVSYVDGSSYYRITWQVTNNSATTFNDVRFFHGGDTYFAGDDDSQGHWDDNLKMVYLTNPNPDLTGIMGLYASVQTPSSYYMEGHYSDVETACLDGRLPDTVDPDYVDAGYALEWDRTSLAPGETWTITAYEKWTEAGFVQVFAPADENAGAGDTITYPFTVVNYQAVEDTFDLQLTSCNGWVVNLLSGVTVTIDAGQSTVVNAQVTVPAGTPDGTNDILTLTATSQADGEITNADMVTTYAHYVRAVEDIITAIKGGGGCFIATAAFGSYQEPHVKILRQFRDTCLLTNPAGKAFVRWYYDHSPKYAAVISQNESLKAITRTLLLPLYGVAWTMLKLGTGLWFILCALVLGLAFRKRLLRTKPLLLLAVLAIASPSFAMDLNLFKPAPGESRFIVNQSSWNLPCGSWQWDAFYTYGNNPSKLTVGGTEYDLSERQHVINLGLAYGITDRFQLSLNIPYLVGQSTDVPIAVMDVDSTGLGNVVLAGKYRFSGGSSDQTGFAIVPFVGFDTGDPKNLVSADSTVWGIKCIIDHNFADRTFLTLNLGYASQDGETIAQVSVHNSFLFGAGISYLLANDKTLVGMEVTGRSEGGIFTNDDRTSAEALVFLQQPIGKANMVFGLGTGLIKGYSAGDFRGFIGIKSGF